MIVPAVYDLYVEKREHRIKLLIWRLVNACVFPLLSVGGRNWILALFGAKMGLGGLQYRSFRVYAPWNLELGDRTIIGPGVEIYNKARVEIGHSVVVSKDAYLCTASHDVNSKSMRLVTKPIIVGNVAWIAARAVILPGVNIGEGAVVGCAAVVPRSVDPWTVAVGNPAVAVGKRELKPDSAKIPA